jgi:hypothetical protein
MKKLSVLLIIVGLAGVVAECIGITQLLKTGTCASGGPYLIARPCPSGTGATIGLFGGGMTIAILCMTAVALTGGGGLFGGAGLVLWAGEFVGVGASGIVWAILSHNAQPGSKLAAYIIGVIFIPMGGIPLLLGIRSGMSGAEDKIVSRRSKQADATISDVAELQRYGTNQARVRITYAVSPADGTSFEISRETNAIISHMPRRGDHARISYDPRHRDRFEMISTGARADATSASPPPPPPLSSAISVPGVPGDTAQLPWATVPVAAVSQRVSGGPDPVARLKQLSDLHDSGALTDGEFQLEKSKILAES